ncbi:MAG: hypothetical protein R6U96_15630 [Promethearchaeia archaeon]
MGNLEKALKNYFDELSTEVIQNLGKVLRYMSKERKISYHIIKDIVSNEPEDFLLQLFELKLLIPPKSFQSSLEWNNQIYNPQPSNEYKLPKIIEILVETAITSGDWNPNNAIRVIFRKKGDPDWKKIPFLIEEMKKYIKYQQINGNQIRKSCTRVGLKNRANSLIAELKGAYVISPKLSASFFKTIKQGSPIYEVNPSVV